MVLFLLSATFGTKLVKDWFSPEATRVNADNKKDAHVDVFYWKQALQVLALRVTYSRADYQ